MKAHIYLSIALLTATCCCFSSFCADTAKKALNRKDRDVLEHKYTDLHAKKNKNLDELKKQEEIAGQMLHAYQQLQKRDYDQHAKMRQDQIALWSANEKAAHDELREHQRFTLIQGNKVILNQLSNTSTPAETKSFCLEQYYKITHALHVISEENLRENPTSNKAQKENDDLMDKSIILRTVLTMPNITTPPPVPTAPRTPDASEPVSAITTPTPMATTTIAAPTTSQTSAAQPLIAVNAEIPTSSFAKATADATADKPTEVKTEQKNNEQKDKNCIIL
jgi:hypothetical protein